MPFNDPLLTIAAVFPVVFMAIGLAFAVWALRVRLPADVEADVLAALSDAEALSVAKVCTRPPLAGQTVDPATISFALEHLRRTGRAVRWFAEAADEAHRQPVYRRVA